MKKYIAEMIGTMILVLFGCGSVVFAGEQIGNVGIALAFGISIIAVAYGIGMISGAHLNPAVSIGAFIAKRIDAKDLGMYIVFQVIGAIIGSLILMIMAGGTESGLGINMIGDGHTVIQGALFELIFTFIFVIVILGVTSKHGENKFAGLAIGMTLTAIHLVGIPITGTSVNPARSIAPALVTMDTTALGQLWIFIIMPILGASLAGIVMNYLLKK